MSSQSVLTKSRMLLGATMLFAANIANAGAISEVAVLPSAPTAETPISVNVSGTMPTPCYSVDSSAFVKDMTIDVKVTIVPTSDICVQVVSDWKTSLGIGILPAGNYTINVLVNGGEWDSYTSVFDVAEGYAGRMDIVFEPQVSGNAFTFGDTLSISYTLENTGITEDETADLKMWLEFPNGDLMPLVSAPKVTVPLGESSSAEVLNYTLNGSEQSGTYAVGTRVIDTVRGDIIKQKFETFQVGF